MNEAVEHVETATTTAQTWRVEDADVLGARVADELVLCHVEEKAIRAVLDLLKTSQRAAPGAFAHETREKAIRLLDVVVSAWGDMPNLRRPDDAASPAPAPEAP